VAGLGFGPLLGAFGGSRGIDRLKSRYLGNRASIRSLKL